MYKSKIRKIFLIFLFVLGISFSIYTYAVEDVNSKPASINLDSGIDINDAIASSIVTVEESNNPEIIEALNNLENLNVSYRTHVEQIGWQDYVSEGETAGTTGEGKRVEAICIRLNGSDTIKVKYRAHVQDIGWQNWAYDGNIAGTTGQAKRIEAIQIELENTDEYSIAYRTYVQSRGWQNWVYDGNVAGTIGQNRRIEAIQIKVIEKKELPPKIQYRTHVQDIGWQNWAYDGNTAGTSGQSKRIEAINIKLSGSDTVKVKYRAHIQDIGWQNWAYGGNIAGTSGQGKRMEAIQIELENTQRYSIAYRVHVQDIGWQNWVYDGNIAGTVGQGKRIEAIQIKIILKEEKSSYWGIDVSNWQGTIDWNAVKNSGVEFAILKIGYGRHNYQKDSQFERNYRECKRLNIPIGIYLYSYAQDVEGARLEAANCLNWIDNRGIELPIFYDLEDDSIAGLSRDTITSMAVEFSNRIQQAGYIPGVYANLNWFNNKIDVSRLGHCEIWLAHYTWSVNKPTSYEGRYGIWQYSSKGAVNGISGDVDMDIMYTN